MDETNPLLTTLWACSTLEIRQCRHRASSFPSSENHPRSKCLCCVCKHWFCWRKWFYLNLKKHLFFCPPYRLCGEDMLKGWWVQTTQKIVCVFFQSWQLMGRRTRVRNESHLAGYKHFSPWFLINFSEGGAIRVRGDNRSFALCFRR